MRIDEITVFVKVVEAGSFAAAARALAMPKATVSAKIAALEQRLGVTLIQRTTRSLRPTPAGVGYFERCRRGLAEIEAAEAALAAEAEEPVGVLRITAPVVYGEGLLPSLLGGFLERHPTLKADAIVTNRELDLVADGIDVALRVGPMRDTSYVARRFLSDGGSLYASDAYIKRHGEPGTPDDLASHRVVGGGRSQLRMTRNGEPVDVTIDPAIAADDFHMTRSLIEMGAGIGYLPDIMVRGSRQPGRLRRVLADYRRFGTISFVYPNQPFVPVRVRLFIAYALERANEWGK
jgi:DNA-binding transcriptional LysR family regulator